MTLLYVEWNIKPYSLAPLAKK